jgi:hypothetical protein
VLKAKTRNEPPRRSMRMTRPNAVTGVYAVCRGGETLCCDFAKILQMDSRGGPDWVRNASRRVTKRRRRPSRGRIEHSCVRLAVLKFSAVSDDIPNRCAFADTRIASAENGGRMASEEQPCESLNR